MRDKITICNFSIVDRTYPSRGASLTCHGLKGLHFALHKSRLFRSSKTNLQLQYQRSGRVERHYKYLLQTSASVCIVPQSLSEPLELANNWMRRRHLPTLRPRRRLNPFGKVVTIKVVPIDDMSAPILCGTFLTSQHP